MDFVGGGGGGGGGSGTGASVGGLGSDNGPILYSEPNRTSAIDDIRSVVIYIFIITIFVSFFLILPGIRYEKFPTFLCITTSLIVTSIILVALFGTNWHVAEAPISAAYKAFSRDRIQGELSVRIGFQSVNITLRAHKYYILHATHGPIIMDNTPMTAGGTSQKTTTTTTTPTEATVTVPATGSEAPISSQSGATSSAKSFINEEEDDTSSASNLADELLGGRTSDGSTVDTELEVDEVFAKSSMASKQEQANSRRSRSSNITDINNNQNSGSQIRKRSTIHRSESLISNGEIENLKQQSRRRLEEGETLVVSNGQRYTIKRVNVDINYNERFYWIEPNQMRQEHQNALARGLPYPILTVVEYLSQDEAGFSWSRQYRMAAPKYGIYTMQILGCLLLFTNLTYAVLVPRGEQKLVIPFEGQSLVFKFGWNFWLVLIGGGLSLVVGTLIVIIDSLFPNFIFTTILDVDFDSHNKYYKHRRKRHEQKNNLNALSERPNKPPFLDHQSSATSSATKSSSSSSKHSSSSISTSSSLNGASIGSAESSAQLAIREQQNQVSKFKGFDRKIHHRGAASRLDGLFVEPTSNKRPATATSGDQVASSQLIVSDSESIQSSEAQKQLKDGSSVLQIGADEGETNRFAAGQHHSAVTATTTTNTKHYHHHQQHHYENKRQATGEKSHNLKSTDHLSQTNARRSSDEIKDGFHQIRL